MQVGGREVHIVRTKLAGGIVKAYAYLGRGGPRIPADPDAADFLAVAQATLEADRKEEGLRLARLRINGEVAAKAEKAREVKQLASKLVRNARMRAGRRGLQCDLTLEQISAVLEEQGMKCAVSGLPFDLTANLEGAYSRNPFGPSLDRVDSKKGYLADNIRIVLSAVNYGINEWGFDQYLTICRAVIASAKR